MPELDFTVARLRELQLEAEQALEAARLAFARVERAVAKIDGEVERLERDTGSGEPKGQRGGFASPLQAMAYIAMWLASEDSGDEDGVSAEEYRLYLEGLTHKSGAQDLAKLPESLERGRGHHFVVSRGRYKLRDNGIRAVQLHWDRVAGIPKGRKPPL